jgi:hypothetical protein
MDPMDKVRRTSFPITVHNQLCDLAHQRVVSSICFFEANGLKVAEQARGARSKVAKHLSGILESARVSQWLG